MKIRCKALLQGEEGQRVTSLSLLQKIGKVTNGRGTKAGRNQPGNRLTWTWIPGRTPDVAAGNCPAPVFPFHRPAPLPPDGCPPWPPRCAPLPAPHRARSG